MNRLLKNSIMALAACVAISSAACADPWAHHVEQTYNISEIAPYDSADSVLGKPTLLIEEPGDEHTSAGEFHCSLVYSAAWVGPNDTRLIAEIIGDGYITVRFDDPIYDDPDNWDQKDFIVFGNARFAGIGYISTDTNMESYTLKSDGEMGGEPMTVSVSQDGVNWFNYDKPDDPHADDYAPTQSFAWDWVNHTWGPELDFTKPVPKNLTPNDFYARTAAQAMDMYKDSGGGTSFDISGFDLPRDPVTGWKWIKYIKVTANVPDVYDSFYKMEGEVDAFARVGHTIKPIAAGLAKKLDNGTRVILNEGVVIAATYETGPFCYIEHDNRCSGIKVMGRVLPRNTKVVVYGIVDTVDGEKVIRATALEDMGLVPKVAPVGMPNKSLGNAGLDNTGMLVRTWGKVKSVDNLAKSFMISDGSGVEVKCVAPRDITNGINPRVDFTPPHQDQYVSVSGIVTCEDDGQGQLLPVVRLRDAGDLAKLTP
ncbi:MAG: hypothetical protein ABFD54_05170 [Armatimonadota bacterium]|nr:hypothetical protein [bacterium]